MCNDKLHIFTYKNTIYQSKLKLSAIFGQSRFSSTVRFSDRIHFHQQTDSTRAQFIIQKWSYLD
jgi:inner membrane protein involved in colicin E2 resistance